MWCMACLSDYVVEGDECPDCGNRDPKTFTDDRAELEYAQLGDREYIRHLEKIVTNKAGQRMEADQKLRLQCFSSVLRTPGIAHDHNIVSIIGDAKQLYEWVNPGGADNAEDRESTARPDPIG